ncbi:MAG: NUDIX domain-containing protein [Chloroflexi bacterium]|nr:NUDIX domain-containing protein [Chloroflexota bacterium]MCI0577247.1 NUDIX domain-containing protein [Chloroflexota bacterium]MCI0646728.1 NUDIX domain-containing protein [Chloroflexota bacterium]MCI0731362.1 NUDIX domain-containing protein [Chloroflexota bacterium]
MNFSESYLGRLRQKVGRDLIQVPGGRIILEDAAGRILLQRRPDFDRWGLPAGSPEEGETAAESIRREVLEETGLVLTHLECFGFSSNPAYERVTYPNGDQVHCYSLLFFSNRWEGTLSAANEESLELAFFAPAALPDLLPNMRRAIEMFWQYKETGQFQLD